MHTRHPVQVCALYRVTVMIAALWWVLLFGACTGRNTLVDDPFVAGVAPAFTEETHETGAVYAARLNPQGQQLASWKELAPALARSRAYVGARPGDEIAVAQDDVTVMWADVARTLDRLEALLPRLDSEPQLFAAHFRWLRLTQGADFSGYYEPVIKASPKPDQGLSRALYAPPVDLKTLDLGQFELPLIGQRIQYRVHKGQAVPYYSREEIDEGGVLRGQNLELAWVDPVDAFFLHIQGSGRLEYADGSQRPVLFAAKNGRQYVALGRWLADRGEIERPASMEAIRSWFAANPETMQKAMNVNENYVFFRFADAGPIGGMGQLLTPWVSLAVDRNLLPLGAPVAFAVDVPTPQGTRSMHGLGFAQDTGGAVKGRLLDIFCGSGEEAAYTAGRLNTQGTAWLLMAKD